MTCKASSYTALANAGLDGPRLLAAVGALTFYVNGFVAAENTWRTWIRDPSAETELRSKAQRHLEERPELYPTLALQAQLDDDDFDGQFVLALQMILDGIEAQLSGGSEFSPREG
ncbi:TetR/AcrR family transcriptional regulator C-terminal domain-containing protein [Actinomadura madurae]|uniref:TetR/AcrR family transcriptional regulator C-terminal domain-containing protein n=1 Tax=Actinomadura madurae TaxID=1993 RepID=UPI0020D20B85|nr:TetR/AcrR family transcriptional regulator C-terminal domain-containing protein [Actinomadura madurae]MCP9951469.1 TetR/AcrR family transcriptional regulator C-terminal domain-containing protein [Actinomadura madurae]MCP9980703.1 TetR/AcrR family transcriptional regulator C-terminal domain-containing protein [Actinomadura madurae]MCQ0007791.1 TetR/AcrR family transcriptional regulator C-terminal domain-containing protein [Actinomadura madurae]MCQ0016900.1 TetR/AcrR family transcriptional reg